MTVESEQIREMFETASLGAPENAVGFVMWRITHRYQREVDQALKALDLTHLQFVTLALVAWMARDGRPAQQAEIARFGDIHPMQVSKVAGALETKAMIARVGTKGPGPAKSVTVTAAGLDALRTALPIVISVQQRLFGDDGRPGGSLLKALLRIELDADQRS